MAATRIWLSGSFGLSALMSLTNWETGVRSPLPVSFDMQLVMSSVGVDPVIMAFRRRPSAAAR